MKVAVTVCLIPEAAQGPFVFHGDLPRACAVAAELGYDAVELFAPSSSVLTDPGTLTTITDAGLRVSAVGSGSGWILHRHTLTDPSATKRQAAIEFLQDTIHAAACVRAPVIVGSLQGRSDAPVSRERALGWLAEGLAQASEVAASVGMPLFFEPLNRYETNLLNTIQQTREFLEQHQLQSVRILADWFHMNIEEGDLLGALASAGAWLGHVHVADSNRQALGRGHTLWQPLLQQLQQQQYAGFLSAELFPKPDSHSAATMTVQALRQAGVAP